jgi:hypothetical protein
MATAITRVFGGYRATDVLTTLILKKSDPDHYWDGNTWTLVEPW